MSLEGSTVGRGRFTQPVNTELSQREQGDAVTLLVSAAIGVTSPEPLSASSSTRVLWHLLCLQRGLGPGPALWHGLCLQSGSAAAGQVLLVSPHCWSP